MDDKERIRDSPGDRREAFRQLLTEYTPAALALAINVLRNRQDAEDACQEAFLQVYRHFDRYDSSLSFKNWMYTILYRRCLDVLRKRRRSLRTIGKIRMQTNVEANPRALTASPGWGLSPEWLDRLNARQRAALTLWAVDGFSSQEIGQALGCSSATARVHLFQARKKIKSLLGTEAVSEG